MNQKNQHQLKPKKPICYERIPSNYIGVGHIEYNPMLDLRYYIHRIIHLNVKTAEYLLIYHWWFLRHFFLWFCFCFVVVAFYFLFLGTQLSKISILVFLLLLSCCCVLCVIGIHSGIQWHSATTTNTINKTSKNYWNIVHIDIFSTEQNKTKKNHNNNNNK